MTVLLSLVAALAYGISDFVGGLASRRRPPVTVLLYSYPVGGVLMSALLPLFPGTLSGATIGYGVAGGLAGMVGVISLYSALSVAPMNVVSPITAVLAAAVPVAYGVLDGERPALAAWIGIVLGMLSVVLVTRSPAAPDAPDPPTGVQGRLSARALALSLLAGVGFGLYFILLAEAPDDSGIWPLVVSRLTSALLIVPIALVGRHAQRLPRDVLVLAVVAGALDAAANLFFLLASREGLLSLASVITALYPAATVVLAVWLLKERTGLLQRVGLVLAAASVVLITV